MHFLGGNDLQECLLSFSGYAIFATVLGGILILAVITTIIIYLLRQKNRNFYRQLQADEDEDENDQQLKSKTEVDRLRSAFAEEFKNEAATSRDTFVVSNNSDVELNMDSRSLSSYGDLGQRLPSLASNTLGSGTLQKIHLSLVLNSEKKYIAGKITKIEGMLLPEDGGPNQLKVNISLLPERKYILKTKYHNITGSCKMDDYFKMKFKKMPDIGSSAIRCRVYCRRLRHGMSGREACLGECFVDFSEIAKHRGGLTLTREILPKGISRSTSAVSLP